MKKWMIFKRESDGAYFLYNGEGCIRVSTIYGFVKTEETPKWHHDYEWFPDIEKTILNELLDNPKRRVFQLLGRGRYYITARGEFQE